MNLLNSNVTCDLIFALLYMSNIGFCNGNIAKFDELIVHKDALMVHHSFENVALYTQCAARAIQNKNKYFKHDNVKQTCQTGFLDYFAADIEGGMIDIVMGLGVETLPENDPWYSDHFIALTKGITGPIAKRTSDQAFLVLPNVDPTKQVFPVAVNSANQPTILAGFYGKGRFVLAGNWRQFEEPADDDEKALVSNVVSWLCDKEDTALENILVAARDYENIYKHGSSPYYVKATELEGSSHEVYTALSKSDDEYEWPDDDVKSVLKWVGESGGGVLLVGPLDWASSPSDLLAKRKLTVNQLTAHFGAYFAYNDEFPTGYLANQGPPGISAYFYPSHIENLADEASKDLAGREAAIVLHWASQANMSHKIQEQILQLAVPLLETTNLEAKELEYRNLALSLLPIYAETDTSKLVSILKPAWNCKRVGDGATKVANKKIIFQESTINDVHAVNSAWYPTGLYADAGDVVTFHFEGPIINSGAYIQIGQFDVNSEEDRSTHKKFVEGMGLRQKITNSQQILGQPWGGPIYIVLPVMTQIDESEITIDGAYEKLTFKLDEMTNAEFVSQVQNTEVPWVDLQAPGWISFPIPTDFAKEEITEPTEIMQFWKDRMKEITEFAGYGAQRPWMEVCPLGPEKDTTDVDKWEYPFGNAPYFPESLSVYFDLDNMNTRDVFRGAYSIYHDIGHWHTQHGFWETRYVASCAEDWFAIAIIEANEELTTEYFTERMVQTLSYFNKYERLFDDLNKQICTFSHLLLAQEYGWSTFTDTMKKFLESPSLQSLSIDQKYGAWALEYSKVINGNACEHYKWFTWPIDEDALLQCNSLPSIPNLIDAHVFDGQPDSSPACEPDWIAIDGACFLISDHFAASWDDAKSRCETLGAVLASCLTREQAFRIAYMQQYNTLGNVPNYMWIGFHDRDNNHKLYWVTGTEIDHTVIPWENGHNPYLPGGPYDNDGRPGLCAYYRYGVVVLNTCADDELNYICQKGGNTC